jgi:hypothetical protein
MAPPLYQLGLSALVGNVGEKLFHLVLATLESHQKTAVVDARGPADPFVVFDDFPFSFADSDSQVVGGKDIEKHFFIGDSHNLRDSGSLELENATPDSLDVRELLGNGIVLQTVLQEEPVLQIAGPGLHRFKFVSSQGVG